jgi:ketosteroid isomerase-like protein
MDVAGWAPPSWAISADARPWDSPSMPAENLDRVSSMWTALSDGDLAPLEFVLAPDAKWRAVEDGPWNCENRSAILDVMRRNLARGLSGRIDEVLDVGDRIVVAFRPDDPAPGQWPLDNGVRYMVLTMRDGTTTEMTGCATRGDALAYANGA